MKNIIQNRISLRIVAVLAGFLFSFQISWASAISRENVVDLVNYSRVKEGLNVLAENSKLNQAAMEKAKDMIQRNYFAHTSPQNVSPWFWFEKNEYEYQYAGENLAINFQNAEEEHEAWMESADHKKNILNPKYQEIGVAVEKGMIDNRLATVTVQLFGTREGAVAVLGQAANKGSLELLNRELESGPWGQLAFVKSPAKEAPVIQEAPLLKNPIQTKPLPSFVPKTNQWIDFFEGASALLILASVGINPLLFGWLVIQKRKPNYQLVFPIKVAVTK